MAKIVLFGATGFTGRLTAKALIGRGVAPVLAGRNAVALEQLASELGGAETAVADVSDSASVGSLVDRGDVLISTVGPFLHHGGPALAAAIESGAHYLDSTGEGPFIRDVFENHGRAAAKAGSGLLTAFGFDFVPGNLAAALALAASGPEATRVDVGYFMSNVNASGGTRASLAGVMLGRGYALRGGRLVAARPAAHRRTFSVQAKPRTGVSIPASEHLALPRIHDGLTDVSVYIGLPPSAARAAQLVSLATEPVRRVAVANRLVERVLERAVPGSTGGPGEDARGRASSWIVAEASNPAGKVLASITLKGGDPYDFTSAILAWGAHTALDGGLRALGALGPVDAFGLPVLAAGAAEAGLSEC